MAGHYYYDPRPFYGLSMSSNLMPLDELFYRYEPVPYWMDQRMAPVAYPDYHPGHVKQVMTRGAEVQQFLPYNRPEMAVRDDFYADTYKCPPHFAGFGSFPETRQARGLSQDDTYLHTMTPHQGPFPHPGVVPHLGYGAMVDVPRGNGSGGQQQYLRQGGLVPAHAHGNNQNFPIQRYNGGEHTDVTGRGGRNHSSNHNHGNSTQSYNDWSTQGYNNGSSTRGHNSDDIYGTKGDKKTSDSNDNDYSNNPNNTRSKQEIYNNDNGYGNRTVNNKSKQETYNDDSGYGAKSSNRSKQESYNDDNGYGTKSSNRSKQETYTDDYGYGTKTCNKKGISNDDNYSTKRNGNSSYGVDTKQNQKQQLQQRYMGDDSSSDDDEDEYGGGKWGTKPLLKQGKLDSSADGKKHGVAMGTKKSGKGSESQSYGSGKKLNQQNHGSQIKPSSKTSYQRAGDTSSDDDNYGYTKKEARAVQRNHAITNLQHNHGQQVQSYSQQPKHMQFQSQLKFVELKVPICCDNCERKVTALLVNVDGVESVLCDQWQKKVVVYGNVKPDVALKRVRRLKKSAELWQPTPKRVPMF